MSDQRGLLAADAPAFDPTAFRGAVGVDKPVAQSGVLTQLWTVSQNAAGYNELQDAEQQTAVERAYDPIIAELERRGIKDNYTWRFLGSDPFYNEGRIFDGIARARAIDPSAFKDVPDDPQAFRARAAAPVAAKYAERNQIEASSGWAPWLVGQFAGSLSDPINLIGMLDGATEAKTIAQAALRDAAVNVKLTAMQMPANAIAAARNGRETTPGETAEELAIAGLTGAAGGAAIKGGAQLLGRTPWGKLADQVREAIPPDRRTAHEDAAIAALDRTDETLRASPFRSGPGSDAHMARMDEALRTLADPPPADAPVPRETSAPRFDFDDWSQRAGRAESGNEWRRQAEGSSAYGRWQITHDTFVRFSGDGLNSGEAAWANRANPAVQLGVFENLTRHNRAVLARIGAPESYGNLYLLHFAGEGAGARILEAAPDTAIETLVSKAAVKANPWLKGMTAEEVRAWAARKMGEAPHEGPVLRRELFAEDAAGDAEFAAAQRAVDAAEAARAENDAGGGAQAAGERDPFDPRGWDDDEAAWTPVEAEAPEPIPNAQSEWQGAYRRMMAEKDGEAPGVLYHPDIGTIDVKWGEPGRGDTFAGGYGLAHILAKHPEMAERLDELPELIREMHVVSDDGRSIRLKGDTHEAGVRLDWDGQEQRWLVTAYEPNAPATPVSSRGAAGDRASPGLGAEPDISDTVAGSKEPTTPAVADYVDRYLAGEGRGETHADREMQQFAQSHAAAIEAEFRRRASTSPGAAAGDGPSITGFDHPGDVAAARESDSLAHDIAMMLDEDPEMTVQLDDEGRPVKAREALAETQADEAAIDAARACLAPPTGETP